MGPEGRSLWVGRVAVYTSVLFLLGRGVMLWGRSGTDCGGGSSSFSVASSLPLEPVPVNDVYAQGACGCRLPDVYPTLVRSGIRTALQAGRSVVSAPKMPKLGAMVQSFNHQDNIKNISTGLRTSKYVSEVVICEDGSTDGSFMKWVSSLDKEKHVVIRSNNLHEMRSYNRAMRVMESDVIVILQDDDLLPASESWLANALRLFELYPNLGVLSGYIGQTWNYQTNKGYEFGEHRSTHGGKRMGDTAKIPFVEPTLQIPFMFVECGWIAPLFVRRSFIVEVAGFDLNIAKIGEPGVWQDCILSFEAWVHGYQVAVFDGYLKRGVGGHGSASSEHKMKLRAMVWERANHYSRRRFVRPKMHEYVTKLNNKTLQARAR